MNTYLDVLSSGRVAPIRPAEAVDVPPETSCALDLAERDGMTLEAVGVALNLTRERIRQIERRALRKVALYSGAVLADLAKGLGETWK